MAGIKAQINAFLQKIYHGLPLPIKLKRKLKAELLKLSQFGRRRSIALSTAKVLTGIAQKHTNLPDIFVFCIIDWAFRIQRPQHFARALAERGHRVFYVANTFIDSAAPQFQLENIISGLPLYRLKLALQDSPSIYSHLLNAKELVQLRQGLGNCMFQADVQRVLAIVQHPFWHKLAFFMPDTSVIYDCMDYHAGFTNNSAELINQEKQLAKMADLVIVSSKKTLC